MDGQIGENANTQAKIEYGIIILHVKALATLLTDFLSVKAHEGRSNLKATL